MSEEEHRQKLNQLGRAVAVESKARDELFGLGVDMKPKVSPQDRDGMMAAASTLFRRKLVRVETEQKAHTAELKDISIKKAANIGGRASSPFDLDKEVATLESAINQAKLKKPGKQFREAIRNAADDERKDLENRHQKKVADIPKIRTGFLGLSIKPSQNAVINLKDERNNRLSNVDKVEEALQDIR